MNLGTLGSRKWGEPYWRMGLRYGLIHTADGGQGLVAGFERAEIAEARSPRTRRPCASAVGPNPISGSRGSPAACVSQPPSLAG